MSGILSKLRSFQKTLPASIASGMPRNTDLPSVARVSHESTDTPDPSPMSPVLQRLRSIPGVMLGRELQGRHERRLAERDAMMARLGGEVVTNELGGFWRRECVFRAEGLQEDPRALSAKDLTALGSDESLAGFDSGQLLFLDTETTGLSGGAGTMAFLIGVGWRDGDRFIVRQYFARDYDEEPALLADLLECLRRFPALVTYNGKGFDVPLLQTRFVLRRFNVSMDRWAHFDLLYAARRLWKARCQSCSLGHLERQVLGLPERVEDIPGEQIPYIYFDFIRGRGFHLLRPVLEHNVQDIVSLAMLTVRAARTLRQPDSSPPLDRWSVARWKFFDREFHEAVSLFECVLQDSLPLEQRFAALRMMGLAYRRLRNLSAAHQVWESLTSPEFPPHPMPFIELAKVEEHARRNWANALVHVRRAEEAIDLHLQMLSGNDPDCRYWPQSALLTTAIVQRYREDLGKRRIRLERKQAGGDETMV